MKKLVGVSLVAAFAALASACAPIPAPRALDEADRVAESPMALEAKKDAAPAWAVAEKRRKEAHETLEQGLAAHAQIIAEESIARYEEAASLARVTRATLRAATAGVRADAAAKDLAKVDGELARATAEVNALELRLKVARDAEPASTSGKASPEREAARREASRSLAVQGRLLCMATRALGAGVAAPQGPPSSTTPEDPTSPAVVSRDLLEAEARLGELDAGLAKTDKPAPIDLATRARASCLSVLTRARRDASRGPGASQGAAGKAGASALLEELSAMAARTAGGMDPARDERGVAVTLRQVFDGDKITSAAAARLAELDRVAAAHPEFALAVVVHTDKPVTDGDRAAWNNRAQRLSDAFASVPAARRVFLVAGDAVPLVSSSSSGRGRNARVEVVFLAPEAL